MSIQAHCIQAYSQQFQPERAVYLNLFFECDYEYTDTLTKAQLYHDYMRLVSKLKIKNVVSH